jgi:chemotaxis protein methyltransferase CheR
LQAAVLICFDQETKTPVLDRVARITEPDGYLVLGAAETVVGLTEGFKPLPEHRGLYVPNPQRKDRVVTDALPRLRLAATRAAR